MKLKLLSVLTFAAACLFFAGTSLAAGPASQGSGFSRQPMMNPGGSNHQRGPMNQEMRGEQRMERMQQREQRPMIDERQTPTLPDQASDTARAAVENAGMGEMTAEAVRETTPSMEAPQETDETSSPELPEQQ
jgi:hypothetical protein